MKPRQLRFGGGSIERRTQLVKEQVDEWYGPVWDGTSSPETEESMRNEAQGGYRVAVLLCLSDLP